MVTFIVRTVFIPSKQKTKLHKIVCENKDFCIVVMLSQNTVILEYNQYQKPDKISPAIYADLEFLIKQVDIDIHIGVHIQCGCLNI